MASAVAIFIALENSAMASSGLPVLFSFCSPWMPNFSPVLNVPCPSRYNSFFSELLCAPPISSFTRELLPSCSNNLFMPSVVAWMPFWIRLSPISTRPPVPSLVRPASSRQASTPCPWVYLYVPPALALLSPNIPLPANSATAPIPSPTGPSAAANDPICSPTPSIVATVALPVAV